MKKNLFSDKRSSKGFYTALGISAVMVGSACFFAYRQGEDLTENMLMENSVHDSVADKKVTGVPRTSVTETTVPSLTASVNTSAERETVTEKAAAQQQSPEDERVAEIPEDEPVAYSEESDVSVNAENREGAEEVFADNSGENAEAEELKAGAVQLDMPSAPLADMSEILSPFSGGELVRSETTGSWQTHNGTDISAEAGAEVYAVSGGEVKRVEQSPLWGVTVTIDHFNGFISKYCGLSDALSIQEGDRLVSGELIGTVGNTADIESALAPHLHLEITHNGVYTDPLALIRQ